MPDVSKQIEDMSRRKKEVVSPEDEDFIRGESKKKSLEDRINDLKNQKGKFNYKKLPFIYENSISWTLISDNRSIKKKIDLNGEFYGPNSIGLLSEVVKIFMDDGQPKEWKSGKI